MELLGIVMLFCILGMGCIIFYLFLQFNRITREAHENGKRTQEGLERLNRKVDELSKSAD